MEMETSLFFPDEENIEDEIKETKTYRIDFKNKRILGKVDGLDAVKQAIIKILGTERFKNLIYSDNYGCEIKDMMMSDENTDAFIESEIPELITDALSDDERIIDVDNFEFVREGIDILRVIFDVATIYGILHMEEVI